MKDPAVIFTGYDARESVGWHVCVQSIIERSSIPVEIIPLGSGNTERDGTNAFTYSRWDVCRRRGFKGPAIFMDCADMLVRADIAELWRLATESKHAVQVVKHDYRTKHRRKYIGTSLEADNFHYPRKNWSSLILWRCDHPLNAVLTTDYVAQHGGDHLHRFCWLPDQEIGALAPEWNVLVGEQETRDAKIAHFTLGIPGFKHYKDSEYAGEWRDVLRRSLRGLQTHAVEETKP